MLNADKFFQNESKFIIGATSPNQIPAPRLPEVAFIGKSNVGKSSLINALVNKKNLAITSKTPGRTRQLNFFLINEKFVIVDMPGYGYAEAPQKEVANWQRLIFSYLEERATLKRVFLLIDSRRGIKANDEDMMGILDKMGVSYQIILTKADAVKKDELNKTIEDIKNSSIKHPAMHPDVLKTSSRKNDGIKELRREIIHNI